MKSSPILNEEKIRNALETLLQTHSLALDISQDPIQCVHRYSQSEDQEIAGIFASALAFGRVSAFLPKIKALLDIADQHGGPKKWIENFDSPMAEEIAHISYRWNKKPDFALLCFTLQRTLRTHSSLGSLFKSLFEPTEVTISPSLERFIEVLRNDALLCASKMEISADSFSALPKGFRLFLCSPKDGSACKRWHLYLRWMIRRTAPDIGIWTLPSSKLCIPLDTHIHSISQMIGLPIGKSANHRAMMKITSFMQRLDPDDPIRFDFALAHLGISKSCKKAWFPDICLNCPLQRICRHTKLSLLSKGV